MKIYIGHEDWKKYFPNTDKTLPQEDVFTSNKDVLIYYGDSNTSHDETKNQGKSMECQGGRITPSIQVITHLYKV